MQLREAILPHHGSLPELSTSPSMRSAACSIAASFHAYQFTCFDLPSARKRGSIPENLQAQRERKQAYHLALKFLKAATLKENPAYDISNYPELEPMARTELETLLSSYLDKKLNALIHEEAQKMGQIKHQYDAHPVANGPW